MFCFLLEIYMKKFKHDEKWFPLFAQICFNSNQENQYQDSKQNVSILIEGKF